MKWCHHLLTLIVVWLSFLQKVQNDLFHMRPGAVELQKKAHSNVLSIHLDDISHRRMKVKWVCNNMRVSSLSDDKLFIFRWTIPLKRTCFRVCCFVCRYRGLFKSINSISTAAYCRQTDCSFSNPSMRNNRLWQLTDDITREIKLVGFNGTLRFPENDRKIVLIFSPSMNLAAQKRLTRM